MEIISRYWNGHTEDHPSIQGAKLSTFSTGVRNAYDAGAGVFVPYPSNLIDSRGNAIPANRGWLYDSLSYQGFAPQFADGGAHFVNRNTFDHDLYRANLEQGRKGTRPQLPETLDFEYRKRPLDAGHVEGIITPEGETFKVRYSNAWGPGIHREIFFGWQRFADEVVIDANTGADQSFRFQIDAPKSGWFNDKGANRKKWDDTTTNEFHGAFELQHAGTGKLSFIRPDFVELKDGSRVPVTIRLVGNLAGARGLVKLLPAAVQAQAVYPIRIGTTDSFFSGAGDGYADNFGGTNFSANRGAADGTDADSTSPSREFRATFAGGVYDIARHFLPFDTSSIGSGSSISASNLKVWYETVIDDDLSSIVVVGPTTQASNTTLVVADFSKCAALDSPNELAARKTLASITTGGYTTHTITDLTVISKIGFTKIGARNSRDVDNSAPTGDNKTIISNSEKAGTSQDPFLEVTYTAGSLLRSNMSGGMQELSGGMRG